MQDVAFSLSNPGPAPASTTGLVRPDGRAPDVVAFESSLVAFFVEVGEMLGIPKSVSAIYGVCFASPEPLGFSEIQERLDISSGSISQGIRVLRDVGALKSVNGSLDRRERFAPDLELRKIVLHFLENRVAKQLHSSRSRLQSIQKSVPGGRSASARILKERLSSLQTWHDKSRALLPVAKTFLRLT
jgi:DNA-binding transcriptional regulator GbsR (MarR family)